jgi:AcrR family transcriptional regulator
MSPVGASFCSVTDQPALRADARRNRSAIVAAARAAFAEHGMDASLDDIAKRAKVGSGTLYRHFATRDDLVAAVFLERMAENVAAVEEARQNPDAWDGFCDYVRRTCRAQATDKGLADLIAIGHRGKELRRLRAEAYDGFVALIDTAKAAGALRGDFTPEDIVLLLMANAGVIHRAGKAAPLASERFVALVLDGFRAEGASPAPPAPSPRTMIAALSGRAY